MPSASRPSFRVLLGSKGGMRNAMRTLPVDAWPPFGRFGFQGVRLVAPPPEVLSLLVPPSRE